MRDCLVLWMNDYNKLVEYVKCKWNAFSET